MYSSPPPSSTPNSSSLLRGTRVLVVDDHDDSLALISFILRRVGAVVLTAATAREAFVLFEAQPPDVLVSDYNMPAQDGLWLVESVRALPAERGGRVPAVLVTANDCAAVEHRARSIGVDRCLDKPVEPQVLVAELGRLLAVRA